MSQTQRVTASDRRAGRIRIPIGEKDALPASRDRLRVRLRGRLFETMAWDPRYGPDRERSGVLYVGTELQELVADDEVLTVSTVGELFVIE